MVVEERERSERREGGVGREAQRRRAALGSSNDGGTGQTHGHKLRSGRLGRSGFLFSFFPPTELTGSPHLKAGSEAVVTGTCAGSTNFTGSSVSAAPNPPDRFTSRSTGRM